jgi:hypothetical protein
MDCNERTEACRARRRSLAPLTQRERAPVRWAAARTVCSTAQPLPIGHRAPPHPPFLSRTSVPTLGQPHPPHCRRIPCLTMARRRRPMRLATRWPSSSERAACGGRIPPHRDRPVQRGLPGALQAPCAEHPPRRRRPRGGVSAKHNGLRGAGALLQGTWGPPRSSCSSCLGPNGPTQPHVLGDDLQ